MALQARKTRHISYFAGSDSVLNEVVHMMRDSESTADRRKAQRFRVSAPLTVTAGDREIPAFTRDLSDRGVYFYLDSDDGGLIKSEIEFVVEFPPEITLSTCCRIRCRGRVLRKEERLKSLTGVAAQILDYLILGDAMSIA